MRIAALIGTTIGALVLTACAGSGGSGAASSASGASSATAGGGTVTAAPSASVTRSAADSTPAADSVAGGSVPDDDPTMPLPTDSATDSVSDAASPSATADEPTPPATAEESTPSSTADEPTPPATTATTLPAAAVSTAGCGTTSPVPIGQPTQRTVQVDGQERDYLIYLPTGYSPDQPAPSVTTFHGLGGNAWLQLVTTGVIESANAHGYVVIAPDAIGGRWQLPTGEGSGAEALASPENAYLDAVLADVDSVACVDPARRYAAGMSLGSAMIFVEACLPNRRFAAFGGVGASVYRPICNAAPPAPIIYFHGTADQVVPYNGGDAMGYPVEAAPANMAEWSAHNGCAQPPTVSTLADLTRSAWTDCMDGAEVDFFSVEGGGHTWPGSPVTTSPAFAGFGGVTTSTISATEAMWDFFSQHSLPTQ